MKRPDPVYSQAPDLPRPLGTAGWELRASHDDADVDTMRAAIEQDLSGGVDGLLIDRSDHLEQRLEGVDLGAVAVSLHANRGESAEALLELDPEAGCLGLDPIGSYARKQLLDVESALTALPAAVEASRPGLRPLCIDTGLYEHAGASDAQAIALALGTAAEMLRAAGAEVLQGTEVRLRLRPTLFGSIARLRALRLCWARLAEVAGIEAPLFAHVRPSLRWLTLQDPHVNLLRNTVVVTAGALGGADAITSLRLESVLGAELSRRVARNTQLVLRDEAHLDAVRDPAGGSYAVESRTLELAEAAWSLFQELEEGGGLVRALSEGRVARWVHASAEQEAQALSAGELAILGVTCFPPPADMVRAQLRQPATVPGDLFVATRLEELLAGSSL